MDVTSTTESNQLKTIKGQLLVNGFNLDLITDDNETLEFVLEGYTKSAEKKVATMKIVKAVRRNLHLNYDVTVLVYQHGLAINDFKDDGTPQPNPLDNLEDPETVEATITDDATLEARFLILPRDVSYEFKPGEYNNLLLVPNPTYENVSPNRQNRVRDTYDNVDEETIDNSFDIDEEIKQNSHVCVTGSIINKKTRERLLTREGIIAAIETLGLNFDDSVKDETDLVVIGESPGVNKIKVAKKKGKRLVSADSFYSELLRKGVVTDASTLEDS
jgi:NAD-dependent DNA ligase